MRGPLGTGQTRTGEGSPQSMLSCPLFSSCSGCTLEDQLTTPPLAADAAMYFAAYGVEHSIVPGPVHGWRCRAKLVVHGSSKRPAIGLYKANSHEVVDIIPQCR